jgi:NAD(P)-dependent dehydrogenase (short-subunit alcohol dehydrogenase family)
METTYTTNVFGVASLIEAALPLLEKSSFPRIVNVSSGLGSITHHTDKESIYYDIKFVVSIPTFNSKNSNPILISYVRPTTRPRVHSTP